VASHRNLEKKCVFREYRIPRGRWGSRSANGTQKYGLWRIRTDEFKRSQGNDLRKSNPKLLPFQPQVIQRIKLTGNSTHNISKCDNFSGNKLTKTGWALESDVWEWSSFMFTTNWSDPIQQWWWLVGNGQEVVGLWTWDLPWFLIEKK